MMIFEPGLQPNRLSSPLSIFTLSSLSSVRLQAPCFVEDRMDGPSILYNLYGTFPTSNKKEKRKKIEGSRFAVC